MWIHSLWVISMTLIYSLHVVTIMFDGDVVFQPFLLYHDEISIGTNATSGVLTCMAESSSPIWRNVVPAELNSSSSPLQSTPSGPGIQRLSCTGASIPNEDQYNGIWSCILHGVGYYFMGIYNRGGGKKIYTNSQEWVQGGGGRRGRWGSAFTPPHFHACIILPPLVLILLLQIQ